MTKTTKASKSQHPFMTLRKRASLVFAWIVDRLIPISPDITVLLRPPKGMLWFSEAVGYGMVEC